MKLTKSEHDYLSIAISNGINFFEYAVNQLAEKKGINTLTIIYIYLTY